MSWESQGIALPVALIVVSLVRPFGLAAAAWLILRVLGVRHPASRHAVWTAVLVGMMLLPVVSVIAPHWKLAVLPRPREQDSAAQAVASVPAFSAFDLPAVDTGQRLAGDRAETGQEAYPISLPTSLSRGIVGDGDLSRGGLGAAVARDIKVAAIAGTAARIE